MEGFCGRLGEVFEDCASAGARTGAVYRVALIQPRGISIVVTHRTSDVRVTLDRPFTLCLVPVELSTSISGIHAATYVVNTYVS